MLNLFPIQFLAPLAFALLRVCVGALLLRLGIRHLKGRAHLQEVFTFTYFKKGVLLATLFGIIEIVIGALFVVGLFTQVAALLLMLLSLKIIIMHTRFTHPLIPQRLFYVLLFSASLSLFITGAGIFAIDLPI